MNGSTVVSFSFADADAFSNSDFLAFQTNSIPYKPIYYTDTQQADIRKTFYETITVANITFVEAEEIGKKVVN